MALHRARERQHRHGHPRGGQHITEHFWWLAQHPYLGRAREDLRPGMRSFPTGGYLIVHRIVEDDVGRLPAVRVGMFPVSSKRLDLIRGGTHESQDFTEESLGTILSYVL